jgi:hypothetical protein
MRREKKVKGERRERRFKIHVRLSLTPPHLIYRRAWPSHCTAYVSLTLVVLSIYDVDDAG